MANKETTVGGIAGFLRLDNDQFIRAINEAIAKTAQLDGKRVEVEVDADTAKANAQLAATEKQVDRLDRANARIAKSGRDAGRGIRPLVMAVIGLGPALIPVAAGATALAVAFGGMATAGVAAIFGIKKEMEEGTAVGDAFQTSIDTAKDGLSDLSRVAARNILRPFQDSVADLMDRLPGLEAQVGDLASITGKATQAFLGGLLNAFQTLEPLMRDASVYVLGLSRSFEQAMGGQGMVAFGDYIRSVFPQILSDLGAITSAAAHLVESLAPLGMGVLAGLRLFSDLISAIPVDTLSVITQLAYAAFLGFKTWDGLKSLFSGVQTGLVKVGVSAETAATSMRALNIASGVIGVALAGLSLIMANHAEQNRQNQQAVDNLTDALIASNGALDEHVRKVQFDALASSGAMDAYKALGGNVRDLVDASLGQADAQERVNDVLKAAKPTAEDFGSAGVVVKGQIVSLTDATKLVGDSVGVANGRLKEGQQAQKDYADATAVATSAQGGAATAAQILGDTYGTSAATYDTVAEKQQKIADKAAAATLQMQLENDAAGLLKQSLDLLNGENMSAAQAQNAFERGMNTLGDPIQRAKEAEAAARKRLAEGGGKAGSGAPSRASTDSLAKAQLGLQQAQDHLASVRGNPKATASALESANQRVARAQLAVSQAQGRVGESAAKASKSTGGLSDSQRKAAQEAIAQAQAQQRAAIALKGNSDEAVTNRSNLLNLAQQAALVAETFGAQKDSAEAGRQKLVELREQIIKNAVAQGFNKDEVVKYLDEIMKIPKSVPPTKADLDTKEALRKKDELQAAINAITGKTVKLTLQEVYQQVGSVAAGRVHNEERLARSGRGPVLKDGGPIPGFANGTIIGPGTGRSDSILAAVAETGRVLRVSAGEFLSTDASRRRNQAALEAGNRGATLAVAGQGQQGGPIDFSRRSMRMLAQELAKVRPVVDIGAVSAALAGEY